MPWNTRLFGKRESIGVEHLPDKLVTGNAHGEMSVH